uniref:SRPBCC family protein n=1 Tax=Paractinoplanes polyasparticus TaxID=2856853 RepID=UPI002101FF62|nr:hypothetical protein [Actinoplanes polyasparticus]
MAHLEQVRSTGDRTSHWSAAAPFGKNVEWDAEIIDETPGEKLGWRSTANADVPYAGTVRFVPAPDGESTEVHVVLVYDIPGGAVGKAVAKYFGEEPQGIPAAPGAGAWMNRSLTLRTGQCHVQRYMKPLLQRIERGEIDPTRIITHTLPLDEAEHGFDIFKNKQDNCEKIVLKP